MTVDVLPLWSNFLKIITLTPRHSGSFLNVNIIVHINFRRSLSLNFLKCLEYLNFAEVSDKYLVYFSLPLVLHIIFALCCTPTMCLVGTRNTKADKTRPLPIGYLPSIRKTNM